MGAKDGAMSLLETAERGQARSEGGRERYRERERESMKEGGRERGLELELEFREKGEQLGHTDAVLRPPGTAREEGLVRRCSSETQSSQWPSRLGNRGTQEGHESGIGFGIGIGEVVDFTYKCGFAMGNELAHGHFFLSYPPHIRTYYCVLIPGHRRGSSQTTTYSLGGGTTLDPPVSNLASRRKHEEHTDTPIGTTAKQQQQQQQQQ